MVRAALRPAVEPEHDHIVILEGASWGDYQRALEIRGERARPRLAFLEGRLELMNPSRAHEGYKSALGRLVEAWCLERGIEFTPYGAWTLESKASERGLEPDECYFLCDVDEPERPDLAIEVVWTSGGLDKLEIYRKLGVREVWTWMKGQIHVHVLVGEDYEDRAESDVLPGVDLELLARLAEVRPVSKAIRSLRDALR